MALVPMQPATALQPPLGISSVQPSLTAAPPTVVIKSQHRRLVFPKDIERIAVGDTEILSAELITAREVLVLGRETGRTSLIIWFSDRTFLEGLFVVTRDLSVLERALKRVHPSIEVESAPDRDALVLTGLVPDISYSQTAEAVARSYLDAGGSGGAIAQPYFGVASQPPPAPLDPAAPGTPQPGAQPSASTTAAPAQLQSPVPPSGTIINLIQLHTLPPLPEHKISEAIEALGGRAVTIRRIQHGDVRDDARDTLVLEGTVPNQIALVRILTVAAQMFAGQTISAEDIRVVADEAGALAGQRQGQDQVGQSQSLGGGGTSALFGGGNRGGRLTNQVRTNLGRAKAIELANGRILSFIDVRDLPQVRVDIRLEEVNRSKLRAFDPNAALLLSSFRQPSLNPAQSATTVQGDQAARVGSMGAAIQNVVSFLNGGLLNQLQYAGNRGAIDAALSLLEREGIARSLSSPSLTVLSGESAQVQIGGEVPIPTAFAPAFGGSTPGGPATPGIFSSVEFVPFGVQLQIRPLVGDDDTITLDVQPLIVTPDSLLTDAIRESTGTNVPTTAFQTRALRTSSRLQDGQALLIGGLVSSNTAMNTGSTPGLGSLPLVGRLFRSFNRNDQETELIVLVNPVVVRTPVPETALWSFPARGELLRSTLEGAAPPKKP